MLREHSYEKNEKRILLKLSGEALGKSYLAVDSKGKSAEGADIENRGIDYKKMDELSAVLADLQNEGFEIGVVVGGGNICRGRDYDKKTNRSEADLIGMLATAVNAMALHDALRRQGAKVRVLSAFPMEKICDSYSFRAAESALENGEIIIFSCGTGNPFFSTDTAAALRALEINAKTLYCAKSVKGVYDVDPKKSDDAKRYEKVSYDEVLEKNLEALDQAAIVLCRENKLPAFVFKLDDPENIKKALKSEITGTWILDKV